ncbi:hypothetical protein A2U01_0052297, partial [Trifolium medium]|nr:hypothetical protein [Trifolium medium]
MAGEEERKEVKRRLEKVKRRERGESTVAWVKQEVGVVYLMAWKLCDSVQ